MTVWDLLVGQPRAAEVLRDAAEAGRRIVAGTDGDHSNNALAHAWLITGPPGSGRSVAARALGAALQCTGDVVGCGKCHGCTSSMAGNNADVRTIATDLVQFTREEARDWVKTAYTHPAGGRWRVIVIEDADRLVGGTGNVLLKAIEEPPERTIWLLCAPTAEEVMPTIRSRSRSLVLRTPPAADVASYIVEQDGAEYEDALEAAQLAQSHVGLARALLRNPDLRGERRELLDTFLSVDSVPGAVLSAGRLLDLAKERTSARVGRVNTREEQEFLRSLGVDSEERVPKAFASRLKQLREDQKRRSRRALQDTLDQALVDLLGFFRDVTVTQHGASTDLVHVDLEEKSALFAAHLSPEQTLAKIRAVEKARLRLRTNANPLLILESLNLELIAPEA